MLTLTEIVDSRTQTAAGAGAGAGLEPASFPATATATARLTLTFEDRRRSRLLVRLDDGREAALMLPRGTVLREGDLLRTADGAVIVQVRAAAETLSVARTADPLLLSRGAYHLGNRHVPLQIGTGRLAYEHDHVLDDLARAVGLEVTTETAPFEPEAGGYRSHAHTHGDDDQPDHAHGDRGLGHRHGEEGHHSHSHSHSHPPPHPHSHPHDHHPHDHNEDGHHS